MEQEQEQRRLSRRTVLRWGGLAGLSITGASIIGCGETLPVPATRTPAAASPVSARSATRVAPATATAEASRTATVITETPSPSLVPGSSRKIRRGGIARPLYQTSIAHLDPATNTWGGGFIFALAYGQLFKWARPPADDPGALNAEPYMAESLERPDDTTAVVRLRPGIKFHDVAPVNGRDLSPDDIRATWERIKDEAVGSSRIKQQLPVHLPEAVDALTATFTFDFPYAPFYNYIADVWQSIISTEAAEQGTDWIKQNLIGTGPWQVDAIDPGVEVRLKPFPASWWTPWVRDEPAPYFEGLLMPVIPDDITQQTIAFLGGQLDYGNVARSEWQTVMDDPRWGYALDLPQDFNYVRINHGIQPMDDVRVRRALSVAIDRPAVVQTVFEGTAAQPTGPIPTTRTPWGQDPADLPYHTYDPQAARQMLDVAGFPEGLEITNLYPSTEGSQTDYVKAISAQLDAIGITVTQDRNEYGAYLEKARLAKTDPEAAGWHINMHWGNRYNDIDGYLAEYRTDGGRNFGHWGNADVDARIAASAQITGVRARVAAVHEINRIVADEAWTPGTVLPAFMEAWNAKVAQMSGAPEWYTGIRCFIDGWFTE